MDFTMSYWTNSLDTLNHLTEFHPVLPLPYCAICSPQNDLPPLSPHSPLHEFEG